jgi:hypothetical protein
MAKPASALIESAETVKIPESRPSEDAVSEASEPVEEAQYLADPVEAMDVALDLSEDGPSLDEDEDTSMAWSLQLHLLSEHAEPLAMPMDDEEAEALHRKLHAVARQSHSIQDRRFRPGRAISVLMLHAQREHELDFPPTALN